MGCISSKFAAEPPTRCDFKPPLSGPRSVSIYKPPMSSDPLETAPAVAFNRPPRVGAFGSPLSPTIVIHPPSSCGGTDYAPSPTTAGTPTHPSLPFPALMTLVPPPIEPTPASTATIPMLSFPHIIANILDYACPPALHAFRAASKLCMEQADARLFLHVVFDDSDPKRSTALAARTEKLQWPGSTPLSRLVIRAPHGRLPICPWANAGSNQRSQMVARLQHARVLDYHCDFDASADAVLAGAFSKVEVIRRIWPSATVLPAPTVVDYVNLSVSGYWTAAAGPGASRLASPTIHPLPIGVKRSVINVIYPTRLGDFLPHLNFGDVHGADIILKFCPVEGDTSPQTQTSRSPVFDTIRIAPVTVMMNGPKPYGFLGGILTSLAGHLQTSTVTFVGLDDVPPVLLGLPPAAPPEQLGCMIAMGTTMCHQMHFVIGQGWVYADCPTSMAAWRTLHRMRFLRTWQYAVEQETQLGLSAADTRLGLEDVPPTFGGSVAALWIPSFPASMPPFLIPVDPGPLPERFQDETVRAVQHWREGFDNGQFGNGCWGEAC